MKLIFIALLVVGCDGGTPPAPACAEIDASTCIGAPPSFKNDVLPILDRSCNEQCHGTVPGVWPLTEYQDVADWGSLVYSDMLNCSMPPTDAGPPLTTAERTLIANWVACNVPNN